ncbi:hypothetical protein TNCV_3831641 [Trichonephila clavipes]|nr:hypothetical protein TNCV_3831641 [Trichonephila clavipes]
MPPVMVSERGPRNSLGQRARVISRLFEHHIGHHLSWFHPSFKEQHPGGGQGPPTSLLFHQPHEKACSLMPIYSTPMP